ncbi:MAG: hypothetical protein R3E12_11580 [Candidatus Eisenbacteria bacterium]
MGTAGTVGLLLLGTPLLPSLHGKQEGWTVLDGAAPVLAGRSQRLGAARTAHASTDAHTALGR